MRVITKDHKKAFTIILGCLLLVLPYVFTAVYPNQAVGNQLSRPDIQGHMDSLTIENGELIAQGWAGVVSPDNKVVSIAIWLSNTLVYEGVFTPVVRPDVAQATGRPDWLNSGWYISAKLPSELKDGNYTARIRATLTNGDSKELTINSQVDHIAINVRHLPRIKIIQGTLITFIASLFAVYLFADSISAWFNNNTFLTFKPFGIFASGLVLLFILLIAFGITGSSLMHGLKNNSFIESDSANIWGKDRPVRSDEWVVFTPLAIAQYTHKPRLPIINTNLGEDGQNMLVVGMVGAPVRHISAIAKPATWGFFLFDLKRALSWYWFFPVFACLFSLWGVLSLLLPNQWRSSFLISLWFVTSPYVAAWSNWPAYAVFFPSLAFVAAVSIFRTYNKYLQLGMSIILGIALAGFVLVLYPPWQVPLGYVFLALGIGIIVRDKLYANITTFRMAMFAIAILITILILLRWWLDAHQAINTISSTIYPGQRTDLSGGNLTLSELMRGFTNLVTLQDLHSPFSNQSEIASFYYFLFPLAFIFVIRLYQGQIDAVEISLAIVIIFTLYYGLIGISPHVSKLSQWGRVPPIRADLALGLSNIILCGLLLSNSSKALPKKIAIRLLALLVALISSVTAFRGVAQLHPSILSAFTPAFFGGLFLVSVVAGYWLASGNFRAFIYLNLALSVATTFPFNPINVAPNEMSAVVPATVRNEQNSPILSLGSQIPAMHLLASGFPVVNGTFYYPQPSLWKRLDPDHSRSGIYNRYQHLIFLGGVVSDKDYYQLELRQADVVNIVVDLIHFDFKKTGAGFLVAFSSDSKALRENASLTFINSDKGWSWFQVKDDERVN